MNFRVFLAVGAFKSALFFAALPAMAGLKSSNETAPPNILLIVADDLGIELGCYGDSQARTPHIDRLALQGVRFETAWVTAASCSPSRGGIHTGLYPHQTGLVGLAHHGFSFDRVYPSIASILREHGYRTGVIGKFHIEPYDSIPWDLRYTPEHDPESPQTRREVLDTNRDVRTMAQIAEAFMNGNTGPFFLMMSYIDPHVPLFDQRFGLPEAPRDSAAVAALPFTGLDDSLMRARSAGYYNCVERLDAGIGILLETLDRMGVADNTVILLIGDHGAPFPRAKATSYDRGLRIPFLVRGPGIPPDQVNDQPVSTVDILPTFLDFAGVALPPSLPGQSLRPLLEGKTPPNPAQPLFASYYAHQKDAVFPMRAVRQGDWLFIKNLQPDTPRPNAGIDGTPLEKSLEQADEKARGIYEAFRNPPSIELYNLATDPYCFDNLAEQPEYQTRLAELRAMLRKFRAETSDPLLDH
jgi:N-sulfoglucosamine sulfohydrolase